MLETIVKYVVAAMLFWSPPSAHPDKNKEQLTAYYESIATDIVTVALDPEEPPVMKGAHPRRATSILLAALAAKESNFEPRIDLGKCLRHECDGGYAFSMWQIHPEIGIKLVGETFRHDRDGMKGPELIADRKKAVRVALHMARSSMKSTGTLCFYTGEPYDDAPKAEVRLSLARSYLESHPGD